MALLSFVLISLKSSLIRSIPRLVALPSPPLQTLAHLPRPGGARSRGPGSEINRRRARSLTPLRSPCVFINTRVRERDNMDVPLRFNPTFTSAAPVVKFGRTLEEKRVQKRHRGGCASPASLSEAREKVVTPDWCSIYTTLKRLHPPRSQESHPGDLVGTRAWWTGSGG